MDRSNGTPLGFVLVVLLAIGFGWALLGGGGHSDPALSSSGTSSSVSAEFAAAQAQPALVWPQDMPEPMTNYVGRRVSAFGLRDAFAPVGSTRWLAYGLTAAGWLLATALVAGITRALRRD